MSVLVHPYIKTIVPPPRFPPIWWCMAEDCDSIASEDFINATVNAEKAWSSATLANMNSLLVSPSMPPMNPRQKKLDCGPKRMHKAAYISTPPRALRIDIAQLDERLESLQQNDLVGKWHFPEMSDVEMRAWLAKFGRRSLVMFRSYLV